MARLVIVSETVYQTTQGKIWQRNAGMRLILMAICSAGRTGACAGNSACVIPTVCAQQSLSFCVTPRLWWHTSAFRPLPSLPQLCHILPAFLVRQTQTGTTAAGTIQFVKDGKHMDLNPCFTLCHTRSDLRQWLLQTGPKRRRDTLTWAQLD